MKVAAFDLVPTHNFFVLAWLVPEEPYVDWTQEHTDQGFAWLPGSITYSLIGNPIDLHLTVETGENCDEDVSPSASRVIRLPFEVPDGIDLAVSTISEPKCFPLPAGPYTVQFEYWGDGYVEDEAFARLRFCPGTGEPKILRADRYLKIPPVLRMDGRPA
jgi:hypothetical protein